MRIPPHIVDEIYRRADILEVVSDYVQLKRKGSYYVGISPFKQERTPSFTVTPSKGIFKCFSTGKGGNVVNFLMEMEGLAYRDALVRLAERYQIDLDFIDDEENQLQKDQTESLYILNEFACKFYQQQLWETETGQLQCLHYLRKRGLTDETIRSYELGYCPDEWDAFTKEALRNKFTEEALLETGLSFRSEKNGKIYDRFRGRAVFPIRNQFGKLAGFGARLLDPEAKAAKYVNSKDSPVYNKSLLLYGMDKARQRIREREEFMLVEGYLDVLALHQAGYTQAVASCGTAATAEQLAQLRRLAKRALILYDSDAAGQAAAVKAAEVSLGQAFETRVLQLPDGHDPDSFIKERGTAAFKEAYEQLTLDVLDFMLKGVENDPQASPADKAARVQSVAALVASIPDDLARSLYLQELARRMDLPVQLVEQAASQAQRTTTNSPRQPTLLESAEPDERIVAVTVASQKHASWYSERELLRLLLNHYEDTVSAGQDEGEAEASAKVLMAYALKEQLDEVQFGDAAHERIRVVLFENVSGPSALMRDLRQLFDQESPEIQQQVAELLSVRHLLSPRFNDTGLMVPALDQDLKDCLDHTLAHYTLRRINQLLRDNADELKKTSQQGQTEDALPQIQKLLKRKMLLEKKRRQITDELGIVVL